MDGSTMEQVREMLLRKWREIGQGAHRDGGAVQETLPQAELIDMAQSLEQMGRDASLAEAERRELLAIERALTKMSSGRFGRCEECGEDIPPKRLLVLPEARLCAQCQAFQERQTSRMRTPGQSAR